MNENLRLFELCPNELPQPTDLNSKLVERCKDTFNKKIKELDSEDLRLLLGQQIALDISVPHALDFLEKDPFISGELYKGDLFSILLNIPEEFWITHIDLNNRLVEIKVDVEEIYETLSEKIIPKLSKFNYL